MKNKFAITLFALGMASYASAQGLYYIGSEAEESSPLKWMLGIRATYDDNVTPGSGPNEESSTSLNPYVGLSFVNSTPQTTWDVYARLGLVYYLDAPSTIDDVHSQSRAGINLTHRFSERLRYVSRNFIAYEIEPDYSYGYANARQVGNYLYWSSDNALGYRWTERFATYTGVRVGGTNYDDVANNDRFTWEVYNQFRYQLTPQTVLTADYRYGQTTASGLASDSSSHYVLGGFEHRISPTTFGYLRAGAQFRDSDLGGNSTSPFVEGGLRAQMNEQFSLRGFVRYGINGYDTVQGLTNSAIAEYDDREELRLGVAADYKISPRLTFNTGIDYISASFNDGRLINAGVPALASAPDLDEDIFNIYAGFTVQLTDYLTAFASYNYTTTSSDLAWRDYDRNRISVGLNAEF